MERIQQLCERHWGIFGDGRLIGDCALHHWNRPAGELEIGGVLKAEYRGQGIMQWAFLQLHTVAQAEFSAKRLVGRTAPDNIAAIRMVSGIGYRMGPIDEGEQTLYYDLGANS